jgi:hypothetical protein
VATTCWATSDVVFDNWGGCAGDIFFQKRGLANFLTTRSTIVFFLIISGRCNTTNTNTKLKFSHFTT